MNDKSRASQCNICLKTGYGLTELRDGSAVHLSCADFFNQDEIDELLKERSRIASDLKSRNATKVLWRRILGWKKRSPDIDRDSKYLEQRIGLIDLEISKKLSEAADFWELHNFEIQRATRYWPGYPPPALWEKLKSTLLNSANGVCSQCGRTDFSAHAHHIIPLSLGGLNEVNNLTLLCLPCHESRHFHNFGSGKRPKTRARFEYNSLTVPQKIRLAKSVGCPIWIKYRDRNDDITERTITLKRQFSSKSLPKRTYVMAFCHSRREERAFRLDRILDAEIEYTSDSA
jgi:hypothetical protein